MKHRAQRAIAELRRRLGMTQQALAVDLGKAVVTVARWETSRLPSTEELLGLHGYAKKRGHEDLAGIFAEAALEASGVSGSRIDRAFTSQREVAFVDALRLLRANRSAPEIDQLLSQIEKLLGEGIEALARKAQHGARVFAATKPELLDLAKQIKTYLEQEQ